MSSPALGGLCWVGESKTNVGQQCARFGCGSNLSKQAVLSAAACIVCRNRRKYLLFHWWP